METQVRGGGGFDKLALFLREGDFLAECAAVVDSISLSQNVNLVT